MRTTTRSLPLLYISCGLGLAACGVDDPVYLTSDPPAVEINVPDREEEAPAARLIVPIRQETDVDRERRASLAMSLGLEPDQVPRVRRDDVDLSLEWTVKNLDDAPAVASLSILGANEWFSYDPELFVIDPDEDEPPPPLLGGKPIELGALGTVSGVIREDEVSEASMDLDAVARAGMTPQAALLTKWPSHTVEGPTVPGGELALIPAEAIPALLEFDVTLEGDAHLVLEVALRVRDHSNRLAPDEEDPGRLIAPSTTPVAPPAPPEEPAP